MFRLGRLWVVLLVLSVHIALLLLLFSPVLMPLMQFLSALLALLPLPLICLPLHFLLIHPKPTSSFYTIGYNKILTLLYGKGDFLLASEWYIQLCSNEVVQGVPIEEIMQVLLKYPIQKHHNCIDIVLSTSKVSIYFDISKPYVSSLLVSRPVQDPQFIKLVYRIMQCGKFLLYAPGGSFPIVLDSSVAEELPEGMENALGKVRIVCYGLKTPVKALSITQLKVSTIQS